MPEPYGILRPGERVRLEVELGLSGGAGLVCREISPRQRVFLSWAVPGRNLGVAIVEVDRAVRFTKEAEEQSVLAAMVRAAELGICPGGECLGLVVPDFQAPIYDDVMDRLLIGDEARAVGGRQRFVMLELP